MTNESKKPDYYRNSSNFLKTLNILFWVSQIFMALGLWGMIKYNMIQTALEFIIWIAIFIFNFFIIGGVRDLRFMINDTNERLNELEGKSNDDD